MINQKNTDSYKIAIIGAGPAGVAAVGKFISSSNARPSILWIDPKFRGGRLERFDNVPSNTKVALFCKFANDGWPEARILKDLRSMDQAKECRLWYAAELVRELSEFDLDNVGKVVGCVEEVERSGDFWILKTMDNGKFSAKNVIFATGAHPRSPPNNRIRVSSIDPELLLTAETIPPGADSC